MRTNTAIKHRLAAVPRMTEPAVATGLVVGRLIDVVDGRPSVCWAGCPVDAVVARVVEGVLTREDLVPATTLLLHLEDGDGARPIVVGVVRDTLSPVADAPPPRPLATSRTLTLDLDRIVLEGKDEVVLRCGQGSITLRADGKVVIKGIELVSRASGTNKVRGATVQIN